MGRRNVYRVLEGCRIRLACKGILGMFGVEGLLQALSTREQDNTFLTREKNPRIRHLELYLPTGPMNPPSKHFNLLPRIADSKNPCA